MRSIITVLILFCSSLAVAQGTAGDPSTGDFYLSGGGVIAGCSGTPSSTGSSGCLVREDFEGTTLCYSGFSSNCEVAWNYAGSSVALAFNDVTAPAPLQKTYSMQAGASVNDKAFLPFTASSTVYVGSMINWTSMPSNVTTTVIAVQAVVGTDLCQLQIYNSTTIQVYNSGGTTQVTTVSAWAGAQTIYVKIKAVAGNGTNASCTPYYSTNGTAWTAGTASTDGTWTANPQYVSFSGDTVITKKIWDDIRVSTNDFNYW